MMGTTHAITGMALATPLVFVAPELAPIAAIAGAAGGIFPDLDLLWGTHRRTLHFPAYYWVAALPAVAVALFAPGITAVALAFFLLSAAIHSVSDVLDAGASMRPWETGADEGVYLHPAGRWLPAQQVFRYDGSPGDFAVSCVLAAPVIALFDGIVPVLAIALIAVGGLYALFRKRIPSSVDRFVE